MKICSRCKIEKNKLEFTKHKNKGDGLYSLCKVCKSQADKKDYLKHKEERIKKMKQYYQAHLEDAKKYREDHKQKIQKYMKPYLKEYYKNHKKERLIYLEKNKEDLIQKRKKYYQDNHKKILQYADNYKEQNRENHYKRRYGLNLQQRKNIYNSLGGKCPICGDVMFVGGKTGNSAIIDHNHKTGKIRGMICSMDNRLLGYAMDNIYILEQSILYLKKSSTLIKWTSQFPKDILKQLYNKQGGLCGICHEGMILGGNGKNHCHIDHDHSTRLVRGLLCAQHNHLLGFAKDNAKTLQRAINYLKNINDIV